VQRTGDYTVTPSVCRHDSLRGPPDRRNRICLDLGDQQLAEFVFSSELTTGTGYWDSPRELSAKTIHLNAGPHVLCVWFDPDADFKFCGLKFELSGPGGREASAK